MTATERRYAGRSEHIVSMDDPNHFGAAFEVLTFKEAIEYHPRILSDYKIITILVTRSEIAELIEKNVIVRPNRGKWDEDIEAEMLAATIALRKAMRKRPIKHTVSFHKQLLREQRLSGKLKMHLVEHFQNLVNLKLFTFQAKLPQLFVAGRWIYLLPQIMV